MARTRILELYLNEIFLGARAYGVAAAAFHYFDKSLSELTLSEIAFLAALPKAPNNYHPVRYRQRAIGRRNWVLGRMRDERVITAQQAARAMEEPLVTKARTDPLTQVDAGYFVQDVRSELLERYGKDLLEQGGLTIHTTLDSGFQQIAIDVLHQGLIDYDRRHGWRGPLARVGTLSQWYDVLDKFEAPPAPETWYPGCCTFSHDG